MRNVAVAAVALTTIGTIVLVVVAALGIARNADECSGKTKNMTVCSKGCIVIPKCVEEK